MEREIGQLTEAVAGLKKGQDDTMDAVVRIGEKLDKHLESQAQKDAALNFRIGKMAGTVALVVSVFLAGAKEALGRVFRS